MAFHRRILAAVTVAFLALILVTARAESPTDYDMSKPENLQPEHLYAESALLVDGTTGEVLFSKNSKVRMYPASTTKIMTLLLGLESGIGLDDQVTIPREAADIAQGSSVVPVLPGDVMRFGDLLYGFMLSSGNDGANAVAVLTDGSIDEFVTHMNARAAQLGMEGTHYANAHGYHDAEHYTTAQDLAILSREAMLNEDFRKIVATPTWTVSLRRDGQPTTIDIVSRNSLLQKDLKYYYPECTGIKTGHHNKAGWCFVGSAERDGMSVICVVLKCVQENDKWYDAARLFEYGVTRYERVSASSLIERAWPELENVKIANADPGDAGGGSLLLNLGAIQGGEATLAVVRDSDASLQGAVGEIAAGIQVEYTRGLEAPVAEGEVMGTLTCALPDGSVATATLTASRSVAEKAAPPSQPTQAPAATVSDGAATEQGKGEAVGRPNAGNKTALIVIVALVGLLACCVLALIVRNRSRRRRRRRRMYSRPRR